MPWDFRALPAERQAELCALHDVDKLIEGYYNDQQMKRMDKDKKPSSGSSIPKSSRYRLK